jgi:fructose-bisphosphate aldolase, class I
MKRCREVAGETLRSVFNHVYTQRVMVEGMILKPNVVLPGLSCPKQETVEEVACGDGPKCLLRVAPAAVPGGIAFLSRDQSSELPSDRLNRMNVIARSPAARLPWPLVFSFARAIQGPVWGIQRGQETRVVVAQDALTHRARCNSAALLGEYKGATERT